jgi:hypothetical protein
MGAEPNGLGWQGVNSYEGEGPVMSMLVGLDEHALHESNVGGEFERGRRSSSRIRACSTEIYIGFTDKSLKVGNQRRIAATGMCTRGIGRNGVTCHRTWKKEVSPGRACDVRNGQWGKTLLFIAIAFVCAHSGQPPQSGSECKTACSDSGTEKAAARYRPLRRMYLVDG